jgi:hypothetical protein
MRRGIIFDIDGVLDFQGIADLVELLTGDCFTARELLEMERER